MLTTADRAAVSETLSAAQAAGFVGPGDLVPQIEHSLAFAAVLQAVVPDAARGVDLGSGGGLPALVLVLASRPMRWTLVEAQHRRGTFLRSELARLGAEDRTEVVVERAEIVARNVEHRGMADVVTARAFGPPAVVAELGSGFLRPGGVLVVSEPPEREARWPREGLALLGLAREPSPDARFATLRQVRPAPDRFPRRVGIPVKRPLF